MMARTAFIAFSSILSIISNVSGFIARTPGSLGPGFKSGVSRSSHTEISMGLMSKVKTAVESFRSKPRSDEELKKGIGQFYDDSSAVWEEIWGEHMHHGYYPDGPRKDHQQAQIDMIEESLKWAGITEVKHALDCGCGIGGSSRHLARKFGCRTTGITLSPKQAVRAQQITTEDPDLGPACKCDFKVADALNQPYPDESFDFIWSMESGEHMPNKEKFVNELARVTTPGGKILIVTWCHRDLEEGETSLTDKEQKLLARINRAYYLPDWCSVADYVTLMKAAGLEDIKRADWTEYIKPFWPAVIRSSLSFRGLRGLWRSGPRTSRGALAMILMIRGYNKGLIKFGLITAAKPASSGGAGQDALKE